MFLAIMNELWQYWYYPYHSLPPHLSSLKVGVDFACHFPVMMRLVTDLLYLLNNAFYPPEGRVSHKTGDLHSPSLRQSEQKLQDFSSFWISKDSWNHSTCHSWKPYRTGQAGLSSRLLESRWGETQSRLFRAAGQSTQGGCLPESSLEAFVHHRGTFKAKLWGLWD